MRTAAMLTVAIATTLPATADAGKVAYRFDTGLDGWTISNATPIHMPAGGNPGGYLFFDNPETTISVATAPLSGGLLGFLHGSLSFDGNLLQQIAPNYPGYGTVTLSGPGGTVSMDFVPGQPPVDVWVTYTVPLTPAAWSVSEGVLAAVLVSVSSISIELEAVFGGEMNGLDNVVFTSRCLADLTGAAGIPDGVHNIDDVDAFVAAWYASDATIADFNGDGLLNIDDIDTFVSSFVGGC